jgi:hypothetical protein
MGKKVITEVPHFLRRVMFIDVFVLEDPRDSQFVLLEFPVVFYSDV